MIDPTRLNGEALRKEARRADAALAAIRKARGGE